MERHISQAKRVTVTRAKIAYDATTKRMRIGYDIPKGDGERSELWVGYTAAMYDDGLRKRMQPFDGRHYDAKSARISSLSWATIVAELKTTDPQGLSDAAYALWQQHFGPVQISASKREANKKRRQRDMNRRWGVKRPRADAPSPTPDTDGEDAVDALNDDELYELFLTLAEYFPDDGYHRLTLMFQTQLNATEAPTVELLQDIRERGITDASGDPQQMFADPEYKAWYNRCVPVDQEKEEDLTLLEHDREESSEGPFTAEWYLADRQRYAATMRRVDKYCDKFGPEEEASFFSGY